MNEGPVRIGTSGYSFEDWVGPFYPEGTPRGKMLDYYARHFDVAEVNSTYYRIPNHAVFYHMHQKTAPDFGFVVKVHQAVTHRRQDSATSMRALHDAVRPLTEAGKLRGFLAQFPWSFRVSEPAYDYLHQLRAQCTDVPLFVEFRHAGWLTDATYAFLREQGIGYCCVDEPALSGLLPPQDIATTGIGYVRLHGRNGAAWWDASRGDRYNYLYTPSELQEWVGRIQTLRAKTQRTFVFFNNCYQGHAVKNASMLIEMLKKHLARNAPSQAGTD